MADDLGCQFARLPSDWVSVAAVGVVAYIRFGNRKNPVSELLSQLDTGANDLDCDLWCAGRALREAHEAGLREGQDAARQQFIDWRGVETPCQRCGGSGVRTYSSTATWHGGAGGQTLTSAVCDGCWGSGDATRTGANLRKLRAESGKLYAEHSRALDRLLEQAEELAALRRELAARRAVDGWLWEWSQRRLAVEIDERLRAYREDGSWVEAPDYPALAAALGLEVEES